MQGSSPETWMSQQAFGHEAASGVGLDMCETCGLHQQSWVDNQDDGKQRARKCAVRSGHARVACGRHMCESMGVCSNSTADKRTP